MTQGILGVGNGVWTGKGGDAGWPVKKAGWWYLGSPGGVANFTTTNTNTLGQVSDTSTAYLIAGWADQTLRMGRIGFVPSTSNASNGASLKVAVFAMKEDGTPGAMLGKSTNGVAVTNATTNPVEVPLGGVVVVPKGGFFLGVFPTATTTAVRSATYNSIGAWSSGVGADTLTKAAGLSGFAAAGFTASGSWATGWRDGMTWTAYGNAATNLPALFYRAA